MERTTREHLIGALAGLKATALAHGLDYSDYKIEYSLTGYRISRNGESLFPFVGYRPLSQMFEMVVAASSSFAAITFAKEEIERKKLQFIAEGGHKIIINSDVSFYLLNAARGNDVAVIIKDTEGSVIVELPLKVE